MPACSMVCQQVSLVQTVSSSRSMSVTIMIRLAGACMPHAYIGCRWVSLQQHEEWSVKATC